MGICTRTQKHESSMFAIIIFLITHSCLLFYNKDEIVLKDATSRAYIKTKAAREIEKKNERQLGKLNANIFRKTESFILLNGRETS